MRKLLLSALLLLASPALAGDFTMPGSQTTRNEHPTFTTQDTSSWVAPGVVFDFPAGSFNAGVMVRSDAYPILALVNGGTQNFGGEISIGGQCNVNNFDCYFGGIGGYGVDTDTGSGGVFLYAPQGTAGQSEYFEIQGSDNASSTGGAILGNPTGGYQGPGTLNIDTGLYVDGVAVGASPWTFTSNYPADGSATAYLGADNGAFMTLENTDTVNHEEDLGIIEFLGTDDVSNATVYSTIDVQADDATNGSEAASWCWSTAWGGDLSGSSICWNQDGTNWQEMEIAFGNDTPTVEKMIEISGQANDAVGFQLRVEITSATPAASDEFFQIYAEGSDDGGQVQYGQVNFTILDATNGTSDGGIDFQTRINDALATVWKIALGGHWVPGADATYDIGTSTVGINDLHIGSTGGVINFDGGDYTITHSANLLTFAGGDITFAADSEINWDGTDVVLESNSAGDALALSGVSGGIDPINTLDNFGGYPVWQIHTTTATSDGSQLSMRWQAGNTGVANHFVFAKAASSTPGTYTAVAADEQLGFIDWEAADGTDLETVANISVAIDGSPGDNDTPGRIVFSTTADGAAASTDRWIIDSAGIFKPATDNANDIGTASLGVRDIFITSDLELGGGTATTITEGDAAGRATVEDKPILTVVGKQVFTTGTAATYTPTAGTKFWKVICTGAGGGGGGSDSDGTGAGAGAGGEGGGTAIKWYNATEMGANAVYDVPADGTAGSATNGTAGGDGGNCTFNPAGTGATITGAGGDGGDGSGANATDVTNTAGGEAEGTATNGDINLPGGPGGDGMNAGIDASFNPPSVWAGDGGGSMWGSGGQGGDVNTATNEAGQNGQAYGTGGGGGATSDSTTGAAGGTGEQGVLVVEEYGS